MIYLKIPDLGVSGRGKIPLHQDRHEKSSQDWKNKQVFGIVIFHVHRRLQRLQANRWSNLWSSNIKVGNASREAWVEGDAVLKKVKKTIYFRILALQFIKNN